MSASELKLLTQSRRIVIKVGSSSVTGENLHQVDTLIDALAASHAKGTEVVLVSSGAIATALPLLNLNGHKPRDLATQQAAAAIGQNLLMSQYQQSLERHNIIGAQILLTAGDIEGQTTRLNAQRAIERLLELRALPIVNENDTVATHEIRFGDNDRLAALVSVLVSADLLIMLSDVDGLYTKPPQHPDAEKISRVPFHGSLHEIEFGESPVNGVGTGGAVTKVAAATYAAKHGVPVLFTAAAKISDLRRIINTDSARLAVKADEFEAETLSLGTWFEANPELRPITESIQLGL